MKRTLTTFLLLSFALLCLCSSFAQAMNPAEAPAKTPAAETAEPQLGIGRTKLTMDGFSLLMGVYSPLHDEMKGIYGGMFAMSGQYCLNMSSSTDILTSVGFMRKSGNPYYDVPTFSSGQESKIRIIPLELSIRRRMVFMRSPDGFVTRGLYIGTGLNYVMAKEEIPDMLEASGGDFGVQIFAGPQIFFTQNFAFEGEIKLFLNEVDMKHEDDRYSVTLSGLVIRAALSWYY